jgi:hypothetical protein
MTAPRNQAPLIFAILLAISTICSHNAAADYPNPEPLKKWVSEGHYRTFEGLQVFVHSSGPKSDDGRGVLIVHGYPGLRGTGKALPPSLIRRPASSYPICSALDTVPRH